MTAFQLSSPAARHEGRRMWTAETEELPGTRGLRLRLSLDGRPATVAGVIDGWRADAEFRAFFDSLLADAPYVGFRRETPGVTTGTLSRPFECVLLDSPGLDGRPDPAAFAGHFPAAEDGVAVFHNLGGDAVLVVPCPLAARSAYGHLAAFVRSAPDAQRHALWRSVGEATARRVGAKPVWVSTAGYGVPWLHVRLDDRPKYYGYGPYAAGHRGPGP